MSRGVDFGHDRQNTSHLMVNEYIEVARLCPNLRETTTSRSATAAAAVLAGFAARKSRLAASILGSGQTDASNYIPYIQYYSEQNRFECLEI